ncbi:YafY family protein [Chryseobacterium sp. RR2-3-20]|uniref:helix-turn-helix transcriptional regulator n=1 Tax=Chryseobacterium sp. RR2-3-20 TaxID=2787626 RepID=UPI001ADF5521|nr:WYL domain-containing protein [Chryseobacterium sp. RR2-3-20]
MAKKDQMLRLMNVVTYLRAKPQGASFEDISKHLEEKNHQDSEVELAFSEKTFQRDRKIMEELLGVEIKFKRSTMTYQIVRDIDDYSEQTIFDNLLLVNAYKQTANYEKLMHFEKRQASGLENLEGIIYAIKSSKIISFNYTKHWEGIPRKKVVQPYALKEFRNRWYLLANDHDGQELFLKTLGLDRISELAISRSTFKKQEVDIDALFVNSFGIISTVGEEPTTITISFEPWQGMFVKSLPIHHTQKILTDTNEQLKIELTLVPTYDFYQELLTHAERILSIEPKSVREEYVNFLQKGIDNLKKMK